MSNPRVLVLRSPGANCDEEACFAFERAGGSAERIHINRLRENPKLLHDFQILCVPGGFSFGDDIAAGRILAHQLTTFLADEFRAFRDRENLVVGICNGFQVLLKAGLIVPPDEDGPLATLTNNAHGRFEDRWVHLTATPGQCVWLRDIRRLHIPIAHGEGSFVCRKDWILRGLGEAGQIVLRYSHADGRPANGEFPANPNGSQGDVAGVCDATGRVFALMPHPERHIVGTQHPRWTRDGLRDEGEGLAVFRNAVNFFTES